MKQLDTQSIENQRFSWEPGALQPRDAHDAPRKDEKNQGAGNDRLPSERMRGSTLSRNINATKW
jgi:hypothetical protein